MKAILQWFHEGGPFIVPLLFIGVLGLALLSERIVHIVVRSSINARPFMETVISLTRSGKFDEALKLCAEHRSALPDLGVVILRSRNAGDGGLAGVAEAATLTAVPSLTRRLGWLPTIAHLAILLGLLGGVANLHEALVRQEGFEVGVAYALRPLAVGLMTAVPLLAGHAILTNAAQKLVAQLEEFSARLVNSLIDRPDVRLGHRS